jgi:hypothetical protein
MDMWLPSKGGGVVTRRRTDIVRHLATPGRFGKFITAGGAGIDRCQCRHRGNGFE